MDSGVKVSMGEMGTWNVTLTVMLELGIQDDEDAEYIVLLELIPDKTKEFSA